MTHAEPKHAEKRPDYTSKVGIPPRVALLIASYRLKELKPAFGIIEVLLLTCCCGNRTAPLEAQIWAGLLRTNRPRRDPYVAPTEYEYLGLDTA